MIGKEKRFICGISYPSEKSILNWRKKKCKIINLPLLNDSTRGASALRHSVLMTNGSWVSGWEKKATSYE